MGCTVLAFYLHHWTRDGEENSILFSCFSYLHLQPEYCMHLCEQGCSKTEEGPDRGTEMMNGFSVSNSRQELTEGRAVQGSTHSCGAACLRILWVQTFL